MQLDPERLHAALGLVPAGAWSLPSSYSVTGVHHGYRQVTIVSAGRPQALAGPWRFVLDELAPVRTAWLSWIDPGGFIRPHRDAGPWHERWQVPINAAGAFHAGDVTHPVDGRAFQVEHWAPHAVTNRADRPRIHLVLDRDVLVDRPAEPFALYPLPGDMADLVEAAGRSADGEQGQPGPGA
jgi:hypothetical protein